MEGDQIDMEVVRFPEVYMLFWELIKILPISVEEVPVTLLGKLILGVKLFEKIDSENSWVSIFKQNLKDWG